jgi:serine/threonine protein kinase
MHNSFCSPPFSGANPLALARSIKLGRFPRIPAQYSNDLARFIGRLLATDPNARPTADDVERTPQIQIFYRESRLKLHYTVLKKREEDVAARERRLLQREQDLARKMQRYAAQLKLAGVTVDDDAFAVDNDIDPLKENRAEQQSPFISRRQS